MSKLMLFIESYKTGAAMEKVRPRCRVVSQGDLTRKFYTVQFINHTLP